MGERKEASNQDTQGYRFIKETIKAKPVNKKQFLVWIAAAAGGAVLFGVVAAIAFSLTLPAAESYLENAEEPSQNVKIPQDKPKETAQPEPEETPTPQVVEVPRDITLADYEKIYNEILSIAEAPRKALVHVWGVQGEEDLLDNSPLSSGESEGIIIENNGRQLYILTGLAGVSGADTVKVSFADGAVAQASQIKGDESTGLAVVKVLADSVKEATLEKISTAKLGNSYSLVQGKAVIAIGCPTGYNDSVAYGNVTSVSNKVSVTDMEYNLLTTDILGSSNGSGVLLDTAGSIIGVIAMSYGPEDTQTMVKALSISQLKPLIEKLSNGKDILYMGIRGREISEETAKRMEISRGIFVDKVEENSPAMEAGIQRGDVLITFNKKKIHTMQRFYAELQKCEEGQKVEAAVLRRGTEDYGRTKINLTLDVR